MKQVNKINLPESLQRIIEARHHDPFEVLGRHIDGKMAVLRVLLPKARSVAPAGTSHRLQRIEGTDLFQGKFPLADIPERCSLEWEDKNGQQHQHYDPYCFPPPIARV